MTELARLLQGGAVSPVDLAELALSFQQTTLWLREQVAKEEKLRALFQQFVPASVAARALGVDADKILAGTRHPVTVMVINIRNMLQRAELTEQDVRTLHGIVKELRYGRRPDRPKRQPGYRREDESS